MAKFNDSKWRRDIFEGNIKLEEGLKHNDMYNMLDIAAGFTSNAHVAASQMWYDAQDLYDYIKSDHIRSNKDRKAFYKAVKRSFPMVKESRDVITEGIEWQAILVKDATVRYNNKPTGGIPGTLQFVGQSYAKVPKGTFLIGLPGGLFAVNIKKKFAMQLTGGRRTWLDAQDKLKDSDVGGTNMAPQFSQWRDLLKR